MGIHSKPIPFRKGRRNANALVRHAARIIRAPHVSIGGETIVTRLLARTGSRRAA